MNFLKKLSKNKLYKIIDDFQNEIKIVIDKKIVDEYRKFWFKKFPRKKCEIKSPILESLNEWVKMNNFARNTKKQKWDHFASWIIQKYNFNKLSLQKCGVQLIFFFDSFRRRDPDNYIPKNMHDGFTKGGLYMDDSFDQIEYLLITRGGVDKQNPRTEFIIRY